MALGAEKKAEAERRARVLYARLMAAKPEDLSPRQWLIKAGVSASFFTDLKKKGSEPSIGNVRLVLEAIGLTIPEFFAQEARGRLFPAPSEQELTEAIRRVLPGLPDPESPFGDRRAEYLAASVLDVLGLPHRMHATETPETDQAGDSETAARSQTSTK